jgi:hypothetical protein
MKSGTPAFRAVNIIDGQISTSSVNPIRGLNALKKRRWHQTISKGTQTT